MGFGSDFDGIEFWPDDCENPSKIPLVIDALRKRYQDRLWEVEFIPTEKDAPKSAAALVSEMKSTVSGLRTIVLVNLTEQEQTLENPCMADWAKVTPENPDIQTATDKLCLSPLSAIVLLEPDAS